MSGRCDDIPYEKKSKLGPQYGGTLFPSGMNHSLSVSVSCREFTTVQEQVHQPSESGGPGRRV